MSAPLLPAPVPLPARLAPHPFAQATVFSPPRHVMARLEADRSLHADIQKKDQNAALAKWRIDHHTDPLSPLARQALFELFHDEPAKGIEVLRSFQAGNMSPHLPTFLMSLLRLGLHRNPPGPPTPCPWILDRWRNSLSRSEFSETRAWPGWTTTPGTGGHKPIRTNFAIINSSNQGAVNVQGRDSHMVSRQIQSTRPGPVSAPTTPDPTWHSSPRRRKRNTPR